MNKKIPPTAIYVGAIILFVVLVYLFFSYALGYVLPFILAVILAALIEPVVNLFDRKLPINRNLSVAVCLFIIIGILVIILLAGASRLFLEVERLVAAIPDFPDLVKEIEVLWDSERMDELLENWEFPPQLQETLEDGMEEIYKTFDQAVRGLLGSLQAGTQKLVNFFIVLFFTFLACYFISSDKEYIENWFFGLVPDKWKTESYALKAELSKSVIGYIRALLILISVTTVITIVGLEIFGVEYSLVIGIISGVLDLIPILGPGLIFVPWAAFSLFFGDTLLGIQLIILYGAIAGVRSVLEPRVIGENIGVHPVATLIALYAGLRIFGPGGVIIGPAILIVTMAVIRAGIIARIKLGKE